MDIALPISGCVDAPSPRASAWVIAVERKNSLNLIPERPIVKEIRAVSSWAG